MNNKSLPQFLGCVATVLLSANPMLATDPASILEGGSWQGTETGVIRQEGGRSVMTAKAAEMTITSSEDLLPGNELEAVVRFAGPSPQWLQLTYGIQKTIGPRSGFLWSLASNPEREAVALYLYDPAKPSAPVKAGAYRTKWSTSVSLGWPEDIRKQIEAGLGSLPSLSQRWLHLRVRPFADGVQLYVDDRLFWDSRGQGEDAAGKIKLRFQNNVELAAVHVRKCEQFPATFEPIALRGYANGADLNGSPVAWQNPTPPVISLGGVPFLAPERNQYQKDHIDVRPSWLASDRADGYEMGNNGAFGGRWTGAFSINPFRMQVTVPRGRFVAIHLLAACANEPNSIQTITAQFYRPGAGHPEQAAANVPLFTARGKAGDSLPVTLANGKKGWLHHVVIPIDPGMLAAFDDLDVVEVEFTKETKLYRAYPDPCYLSFHMAGLPSAAQIYAVTFERPAVGMQVTPAKYANVWTASETPAYTVTLTNTTTRERTVALEMKTASYDGQEKLTLKQNVRVAAGRSATASFSPAPKKYGWHGWTVSMKSGAERWAEQGSLAWLHPDTRERGGWDRGKGTLFGYWECGGGHLTPKPIDVFPVTAQAGFETTSDSLSNPNMTDAGRAVARRLKFSTHKAFGSCDHFFTVAASEQLIKDRQTMSAADAEQRFVTNFVQNPKFAVKPGDLEQPPFFVNIYGEPQLGLYTYQSFPSYDGEPESEDFKGMTPEQEARYKQNEQVFIAGASLIRKYRPEVKILFPHGDACFFVPFVRRNPEMRKLIDGVALDAPYFDLPPEAQMGQLVLHRLYFNREEFRKIGNPHPWLAFFEGPCLPTRPGGLSPEGCVDLVARDSLMLMAYGVDIQVGGMVPFCCADEWGEQRYGNGLIAPIPRLMPYPMFVSVATLTRQLNRCNFDGWLPTGSHSVYALRFKHYKTGATKYVFWTLRGKRPVTLEVGNDRQIAVSDAMDNATTLTAKNGKVTFTVGTAPCYVDGLTAPPQIALGEPDQSDSVPAQGALKLSNLSEWTVSAKRDMDYEESNPMFVRRFPSKMTAAPVAAPKAQGGQALAVHLEKPAKDRPIMPFYTTLVPPRPIIIPGKASHLGLWVKASSDWGRVVYFLRDAKGERWISIGAKSGYNGDDAPRASAFNFDGWRYLRFEMPACSPYDSFIEMGTTWWGSYGNGDGSSAPVNSSSLDFDATGPGKGGDGIVDLPLTLEKILVERRTHEMYVNDPQPCSTNDVLLGELDAEYASDAEKDANAVGLSRLRMPVPTEVGGLKNPIAELAAGGTLPATEIEKTTTPLQEADGRRCYVHFTTKPEAVTYDVWASAYENGLGALCLGKNWKESGGLITGLRRDTDFYLFVTYTDKNGNKSKPSRPFKINLQDTFGMK